jgi:hypothetical protein
VFGATTRGRMMAASSEDVQEGLRLRGRGRYGTRAAAELLIRAFDGRFASADWRWIVQEPMVGSGRTASAIADRYGLLSSGERRLLDVVASLAGESCIDLSEVAGLGRREVQLALAAISHAAGSHQHGDVIVDEDSCQATIVGLDSLHRRGRPSRHRHE